MTRTRTNTASTRRLRPVHWVLIAVALTVVGAWVATSRRPVIAALIAASATLTLLFIARSQVESRRPRVSTRRDPRPVPAALLVSGTRPVGSALLGSQGRESVATLPLPLGRMVVSTANRSAARPVGSSLPKSSGVPKCAIVDLNAPSPGQVMGQYQLLTSVGQGGMARVWAARQIGSRLGRLVAVKTALGTEDEPTEVRCVFLDEARIASLIRHPNVCGVYELGDHHGVLYQVMEWCDGASLRQVLDQLPNQRMELPVAVFLMTKVSAGLHAAHQLEDDDGTPMCVVHRDVSPHNILIAKNGQVKVTDFGVAKARGQLQNLPAAGGLAGKLSYMAPEQIGDREIDHRADIFALGCILYEATVGKSAFPGTDAVNKSQSVVQPRKALPSYPADLEEIVLKAIAPDRNARYQTAEALGIALGGWLARASGVVTEQAIADLLSRTTGTLIDEKARRIQEAMKRFPAPVPLELEAVSGIASANDAGLARPTIPAGPAARKTRVNL